MRALISGAAPPRPRPPAGTPPPASRCERCPRAIRWTLSRRSCQPERRNCRAMTDAQGGRGTTATGRPRRVRAWIEAPLSPLPTPRRLPVWLLGGLVLALTALQMFRRPTAPPVWDSLIAEDGKIFLSQAISQHFLDSLATSYQGYLHTVPRGIALVATWFPLDQAPLVMSLLATFVVSLLALYVFLASGAWIASPLLRAVLALAVPFIPVTAHEMSGTVSNLHWYLLYTAFWALICPWRTRRWLAASTTVVLLA